MEACVAGKPHVRVHTAMMSTSVLPAPAMPRTSLVSFHDPMLLVNTNKG